MTTTDRLPFKPEERRALKDAAAALNRIAKDTPRGVIKQLLVSSAGNFTGITKAKLSDQ